MEPSGPLIAHIFSPLLPFSLRDNVDLILFPKDKKKRRTPAVEIYLYRGGKEIPPPSRKISIELYFGTLLKASS